MRLLNIIVTILLLLTMITCQKSKKLKQVFPSETNFIMSIINPILGGPYDAPILTRLMNKLTHILTLIAGSIFAYFKWFRQRKSRQERINQFIGDQKHKAAIIAEIQNNKIGQKNAQKIIYQLNSEKDRQIAIKSINNHINFNISINIEDIQQESLLIYNTSMIGNDPQGKSIFKGFITFKDKLLQLRLQQTYEKDNNKNENQTVICLFQGKQKKENENVIIGEWWIQGQRGTGGSYCGNWTFLY